MPVSASVDGFSLAYDVSGSGPTVVLLHGWPGMRSDQALVAERLSGCRVVVPDLRGFGESFSRGPSPEEAGVSAFGAEGQAHAVLALLDELGVGSAVLCGYDVGSRVAQTVAKTAPDRVAALVVCPPLPGVGDRVLAPDAMKRFWYQEFHKLDVSSELIDGDERAVRTYLGHVWSTWAGPSWRPDARFDDVVAAYARAGAFTTSVSWYRDSAGTLANALREQTPAREDRLSTPTTVLWPDQDPLFPPAWSDRLEQFFSDFELRPLPGVGHFAPLEAPDALADAIRDRLPLT